MQKIVLGFPLNHEAIMRYAELKGIKLYVFVHPDKKGHINFDILEEYNPVEHENPFSLYYCEESLDDKGELKSLFMHRDIPRDDPILIQVVKEMGKESGNFARIVEIPDDIEWDVTETDDGHEYVEEEHQTWS